MNLIDRLVPPRRLFATVALLTGALQVSIALGEAGTCEELADALIRTAPLAPKAGEPLRILAMTTESPAAGLSLRGPDGMEVPLEATRRGGPPWSLGAEWRPEQAGTYRVLLRRDGREIACREVSVGGAPTGTGAGEHAWDLASEAFFSAWIEQLFGGPPGAELSFPSLQPVLRDPARNFLYDYFGAGEDARIPARPDCADLPYFLRAYFAWKTGLPVSFRACSRGSAGSPPRCGTASVSEFNQPPSPPSAFNAVARRLADTVHSGSARTALDSDATDFYPVPLERNALWPGTIYADPYGHVLMIVGWVPQTGREPGMLLAVDGQPDNSVTRKRFWEGTFLFANTPAAGPGFKAFRPLLEGEGGKLHLPGNADLAMGSRYSPYAIEQAELAPEDFYARLGSLINPNGLEPGEAYEATLDALVEQLETRVTAIENGEKYVRAHPRALIGMPGGAAIFETAGPWEDFATPSRDLRLMIALNVLERLPQRIVRYPNLFRLNGRSPDAARAEIDALHARRIRERQIAYLRSDGSRWPLSIAEIYARRRALEIGYNPNDCPETRWGAPPGTAESATCHRRAPADQRARMEQYRPWFREARRPSR